MQSSYNTGWKMFKTALTALAITAASLVALRQSADALTISVGTQSVVNLPLNVAPDVWVAGSGNGYTVIYTTRDATSFTIMFASQTGISGVSGGAPGWTLSTLYSTTTTGGNTNIAKIIAGGVISNRIVVYYYDDNMKNLMYMSANPGSLPVPTQFAPVGIASATIKGIDVRADAFGSTVLFSSLTANGNYALAIASSSWANASSPITSSILLSTGSAQNVDMTFRISLAQDSGNTKVYFYDTLSQTLEELFLDSGNNPIPTTRGTIDTGMFVNSSIAPFNALAPVNEGSNRTTLLYTDASNGVKVAVQRRNITTQAWYVQVVDAGVAQNLGSGNAGVAYIVDYVKNAGTTSSSLWEARPAGGTYFDDFSESIVNTQQGRAKILSAVNGYSQTSNVTPADKGLFLLSDNTLGAYNYVTLSGSVYDSWGNGALGTGANALAGVSIEANVKNSTVSFGGATVDQNPGAVDANGTTMTQGGITSAGGNYQISVSSGAGIVVTPSSPSWVFYQASSQGAVIITTASWATYSSAMGGENFIGVSSPVLIGATLSVSSGTSFSTASVMFMGMAGGTASSGTVNWSLFNTNDAVYGTGNGTTFPGVFAKSEYARFVAQTGAGVAATVSNSTVSFGDALLFQQDTLTGSAGLPRVVPPMVLGGLAPGVNAAAGGFGPQSPAIYTATGSVWSRFASTDMAATGVTYSLVVSTRLAAGPIMQGAMTNALTLLPLTITTVSIAAADISTPIVNTSFVTTFVIRSSFTNMYPPTTMWSKSQNIFLTTANVTNDAGITGGVSYSSDVPLAPTAVDFSAGRFDTIIATGNVAGLTPGTWYVRISSRPARSDGTILPQTAISGPITIVGPTVTSVTDVNGNPLTTISSGSVTLDLYGKGFISGASGGLVSLSTAGISDSKPIFDVIAGKPSTSATIQTAYNGNATSTFTQVTLNFTQAAGNGVAAGTAFNVIYSTVMSPGGVAAGAGALTAALPWQTTVYAVGPQITFSTPAITSISPSTVSITGVYRLILSGRGLPAGATNVILYATDGSTQTPPINIVELPANASIGGGDFRSQLSVFVDFRSTAMAGKTFSVTMGSWSAVGGTQIFNIASGGSGAYVFVASPTITVMFSTGTGLAPNAVYNSTGNVTFNVAGIGLSPGGVPTLNYPIGLPQLSSVTMYTASFNDTPAISSITRLIVEQTGNGSPLGNGGTGVAGAVGANAFWQSSATVGTVLSTGITNLAAGTYIINVSTTLQTFGTGPTYTVNMSTTFFVVSAAASLTATLNSYPSAITTLQFATYTVSGAGLLPNVSYYLSLPTNQNIGPVAIATNSANYSSFNIAFDLRAATNTSTSWSLVAFSTSGFGAGTGGSTWTAKATNMSITNVPVLGVIPSAVYLNSVSVVGSSGVATTIPITGQGLVLGATVAMTYSGTAVTALGTTDYIGTTIGDSGTRMGQITSVCGAYYAINSLAVGANSAPPCAPGTPAQSTGVVSIVLSTAFPSSSWNLQMQAVIPTGNYGAAAPQGGPANGSNDAVSLLATGNNTYLSNLSTFTVLSSSAPNAPTGLTVLSAGVNTVTLQWVTPGAEGNSFNLTSGANFIVYYSSGQNAGTNSVNGITRGYGCAPCYPVGAITNPNNGALIYGSTNFTFANTWAQFLTYDKAGSAAAISTITNVNATYASNLNSARGVSVATMTIPIANLTVVASTYTGISTGSLTNSGSIQPGTVVQATLSNLNGVNPSNSGYFWFVVRAQNQFGNLSPSNIVYSTVSALVLASPSNTSVVSINPNVTFIDSTTLPDGTVAVLTVPPGTTSPGDNLVKTPEANPPAATSGVALVGSDIDYSLQSGNTTLNNPVTLVFTVPIAAVTNALINAGFSANAYNLVKMAFYNGTRWVIVPDSSFNGTSCSATVTHFTKYAVVIAKAPSNLTGAAVYPNPWRPTLASHAVQQITFDTLPAGSTIKVFTVAGTLVKSLVDDKGTGSIKWNGQNDGGQDLASGVYFCLLQGGGDTKTIKVAIQR